MLLPYNTDAPIYHFPYTTISLIVVNALVFIVTAQLEPDQVLPWTLVFGHGLNPVQWVTNNFLHADFIHLLGNMFYLWGFGLVVEGKLGWERMLLVYLAIATIYGAIIQVMMLGSEGVALGASGAIFGLMAMALIWAPKNEISCFLWIFRPTTVDLSIVFFATSYLVWQVFAAWLTGFGMSSELLHLTGAGVGAVFGVALLKFGIVDCEGWDLFAVLRGKEGDQTERTLPDTAAPPLETKPVGPSPFRMFTIEVKNHLLAGDAASAARVYSAHRKSHPKWILDEPDLMTLIRALHDHQLWSASVRPMVDYLRQFPERSARMRLKLAQILISAEHRPAKALEVLSKLNSKSLSAELQETQRKLLAHAETMKLTSAIEVADGEEW